MKTSVFSFGLFCLAIFGCSEDKSKVTAPKALVTQFNTLFLKATDVTWEMEDSLYEASFRQDTLQKSVALDKHGTVQWMETDIAPEQLPSAIRDYLGKQSGGKKITEASMITYPDGNFAYEAEIEKRNYLFDGAGQFLTVESEEDDEEE